MIGYEIVGLVAAVVHALKISSRTDWLDRACWRLLPTNSQLGPQESALKLRVPFR